MKKQIHQDVFVGFFCLAICLAIFMLTASLPFDAAMMPRLLASLMVLLAIVIIYQGLEKSKAPAEEQKKLLTWDGLKIPLITWGLVFVYVVLFNVAGYFISTGIMIIVLMRFMKQTSWKLIIGIDVVYLLLMYFVFVRMLHVSADGFGMLGRIF